MTQKQYDVAIIGGGIVGLATAHALTDNEVRSVVVLEAEDRVAAHQTGHNSGVIHSGLYYKPGSLKARNCIVGREAMYRFCQEHGIAHERCGKVVVAVEEQELPALEELQRRGTANGLQGLRRLGPEELREFEPHVRGLAGLHVAETGIVDFPGVADKLAELVRTAGGEVRTRARLLQVQRRPDALILQTSAGEVGCRNLINCTGLQSDRVARLCGVVPGVQILPFRGEYYELRPERAFLVRNLIYPVPDPRFPFLGVHFTRTIHGQIEAGPNAVLAFKREGYRRRDVSLRDLWQLSRYRGFWRMAFRYAGMGLAEMHRSFSKRAFLRALQRLVPEVELVDIHPRGSGVRAQAVTPDGKLVDDFHIVEAERMIHVLNAPSPAATASLSIGATIADMARKHFQFAGIAAVSFPV
jgi:L-2-hydroxyglutarate oxidase